MPGAGATRRGGAAFDNGKVHYLLCRSWGEGVWLFLVLCSFHNFHNFSLLQHIDNISGNRDTMDKFTETMTPLQNEADTERVKEIAIKFYDQEHNLTSKDREQLYIFFEQQCRRMLLGFSFGVAIGVAAPFIVRKKGTLVHPGLPVLGAVLGGSIVPGLVNHSIYKMQVEQFKSKFGETSPICQTIAKTPDPITKSVFWSAYFKKSSADPNFRLKDPRTVVNSTKYFSLEDNPKIPPYGKPGYYKSDSSTPPQTLNEQYLSGWDKVRMQKPESSTTAAMISNIPNSTQAEGFKQETFEDDIFGLSSSSPSYTTQTEVTTSISDPPLVEETSAATQSFASVSNGSNREGERKTSSDFLHLDNDHLIQQQGASGSAWDKVRQGSQRQ